MAMPEPKRSLRQGQGQYGASSARRSSSAGWPKAGSISIRGCRRLQNGTWLQAMRWLRPPVAGSRIQAVRRWFLAPGGARILSFRNSSPGAIRTRHPDLLRESLLQHRPARGGLFQEPLGLGGECIAVFLAAEQIEPLARNHPKTRIARIGYAPCHIDRIVAAELGPVDFRMRDEGGAIALAAETPDGAGFAGLEVRQSLKGHGFGEIGDGIETGDGEAGIAVHDHPLGGRGTSGQIQGEATKKPCQ